MSDLLVKPLPERVKRLEKARDSMRPLLENSCLFANNCETIFREFRISCVHLRREREALDALEGKEVAWRFLCKLCRERPFLYDRVHEVLQILMMSDVWMKAFAEDPECRIEDLPPEIQSEIQRRAEQALDPASKTDGYPAGTDSSHQEFKASGTIAVVVQRFVKAKLLLNEAWDSWAELGRGLFVAVSFTKSATEDKLQPAARFLLTAKLSRGSSEAESLLSLCQRGECQGILLLPQASLVSDLKDVDVRYSQQLVKSRAHVLYDAFIQTLHSTAADLMKEAKDNLQIVAGEFDGPQVLEMSSAGPFMHSFSV